MKFIITLQGMCYNMPVRQMRKLGIRTKAICLRPLRAGASVNWCKKKEGPVGGIAITEVRANKALIGVVEMGTERKKWKGKEL